MFGLFKKRGPVPPADPILCAFGPRDFLTERQAFEGVFISGGIGSGKTTGPAAEIQHNAIRLGYGCLWLCAKQEEADRACAIADLYGRSKDVRRIRPGGRWKLDLLDYAASMPGGVENAAQLLDNVSEVGNRKQGRGDEPFWKLGAQRIQRLAITAVRQAIERSSFSDVYEFITSAAQSPEQASSDEWMSDSFCARCLRTFPEDTNNRDLDMSANFWLEEYPAMGDKTRAGLVATVVNVLGKFMTNAVAEILSAGESNVTPHGVEKGEIHVWDIPQLLWQETGQFAQVAAKALYLRSLLGRDVKESPLPVMIVQDEAQMFALAGLDSMAQTVSRSQRIFQLVVTQNIPMLATAMGGDHAKQEVAGWLANFQTKILCQNACHHTNEEMSKLIGQSRQLMWSFGGGSGEDYDPIADGLGLAKPRISGNGREEWQPEVRIEEFGRLQKGGPPHFTVESIVYQGGRKFSNGKPWMRSLFRQRV